eukprot:4693384-Amphidinium_carterae.1
MSLWPLADTLPKHERQPETQHGTPTALCQGAVTKTHLGVSIETDQQLCLVRPWRSESSRFWVSV